MSEQVLLEKLDRMSEQLRDLDRQLADPEVLADPERVRSLSMQRSTLQPLCERHEAYKRLVNEAAELRQMYEEEGDPELRTMAERELPEVERRARSTLESIKTDLVTADDRRVGSVMMEIRAGVGGAEAAIWAGDLYTMYEAYAERQGWDWEVLDFQPADLGGLREAVVNVRGEAVWQHLGYEGGTHCVKRVPKTESQ